MSCQHKPGKKGVYWSEPPTKTKVNFNSAGINSCIDDVGRRLQSALVSKYGPGGIPCPPKPVCPAALCPNEQIREASCSKSCVEVLGRLPQLVPLPYLPPSTRLQHPVQQQSVCPELYQLQQQSPSSQNPQVQQQSSCSQYPQQLQQQSTCPGQTSTIPENPPPMPSSSLPQYQNGAQTYSHSAGEINQHSSAAVPCSSAAHSLRSSSVPPTPGSKSKAICPNFSISRSSKPCGVVSTTKLARCPTEPPSRVTSCALKPTESKIDNSTKESLTKVPSVTADQLAATVSGKIVSGNSERFIPSEKPSKPELVEEEPQGGCDCPGYTPTVGLLDVSWLQFFQFLQADGGWSCNEEKVQVHTRPSEQPF